MSLAKHSWSQAKVKIGCGRFDGQCKTRSFLMIASYDIDVGTSSSRPSLHGHPGMVLNEQVVLSHSCLGLLEYR